MAQTPMGCYLVACAVHVIAARLSRNHDFVEDSALVTINSKTTYSTDIVFILLETGRTVEPHLDYPLSDARVQEACVSLTNLATNEGASIASQDPLASSVG